MIDTLTRASVTARAGNRCEYCQLPQWAYEATFHIDHVIAQQHLKDDREENLALCCPKCNRKKGPNLSGLDPANKLIEPLFHPRLNRWQDEFRWAGLLILGKTASGRATVALLDLNSEDRLVLRRALAAESGFPSGA